MNEILVEPVSRFVEELTPVHATVTGTTLAGVPQHRPPIDVTMEAYNLVAAFIDCDGRHTDSELWAFITAFAPRMETQLLHATPTHVREARLVLDKRAWLAAPSL